MENRPKCSIGGCNNLAVKRGRLKNNSISFRKFCDRHRRERYNSPRALGVEGRRRLRKKLLFPNKKCIICDWEGPCDRHRIIFGQNGGKYIKGNVVIVCPNCHRLIHLGKLNIK